MKVYIYSVRDNVALTYLEPFYANNDGVARRMVANAARDPSHPFCKSPYDYVLFKHGSLDLSDASFETHEPKSLGVAGELAEVRTFGQTVASAAERVKKEMSK